jgi:hypothetical protein
MIRKGQLIYNFLEWLRIRKNLDINQSYRLADTFHLTDEEWDRYLKEFKNEYGISDEEINGL